MRLYKRGITGFNAAQVATILGLNATEITELGTLRALIDAGTVETAADVIDVLELLDGRRITVAVAKTALGL